MTDDLVKTTEHMGLTNLFMSMDPQVARSLVEFFASSMDALLQFYLEAATDTDKNVELSVRARAVAAARIAQMGRYTYEVFALAAETISYGSAEDVKACDAATGVVEAMVLKNLRKLSAMADKAVS